ncbi:TRMT1-like protein isoform X2 [Polyodon spathula]|uniref:TRMT1-like protein isoform X2 n=1 Tax=Polyodon spathula TaxID=7913 RepID=UPI001B7E321C|nr:TRMT1-like protein isoform X2 [Polyodon spathula]
MVQDHINYCYVEVYCYFSCMSFNFTKLKTSVMAELQKEESAQLHQEDAGDKSGSTVCEAKADQEESNIEQCDEGKEKTDQTEDVTNLDPQDESGADNTSMSSTAAAEKHISIQAQLTDLENLTDLNETGKKLCPLCSEEKFKACYNHKLRRHLQNLHWKVSVEFEGHRMCICHLPCRQLKPSLNGDQCSSRLGAHYHCIVCSATIARRTDMISHLKRHVNKGETEASYTGGSDFSIETKVSTKQSCEILKESDTNVQVLPNFSTPQKSDSYFNRKMKTNRQLVFCALAVLSEERSPLECLDAFGATGIMGLQWAQHLCSAVKVTINDINETSVKMIRENCHLNHMRVQGDNEGEEFDEEPVSTIEVTKMDANVLMHLRAFDFIHLDPYGTAVNYLDAAFRNVRNLGIVSVTSTDTSSLYSKTLNVTLRHYSCHIIRTEYYKELAARMVIATMARAAARCNKGIKVLLAVALEHFVLVVVQVLRGPTQADELPKKIQQLIHCQWCEERVFLKEGSMVEENLYRQLPCDCHGSMPGKTAVELGPLWSGSLFNTGFLRRMLFEAVQHEMDEIQPLVKSLICESECTTLKQFSIPGPARNVRQECGVVIKTLEKEEDVSSDEQSLGTGKRKMQEGAGNMLKRQKSEMPAEHPAFYYSIHRHSIRGMNMPKLNKFLQYLTEAGFRVSRTHFDPTGVRTNATLAQFKAVLAKYSVPTYTTVQTGDHSHAAEEVKLDMEFACP